MNNDALVAALNPDIVAAVHRYRLAVLRGGFAAVRRLLGNSRDLPFALTSIMNDNAIAQRVLGANLRGMPCYQPIGEYYTFALSARGRARRATSPAADSGRRASRRRRERLLDREPERR